MLLLFNKVGKGCVLDKGRKVITEVPSVFFYIFDNLKLSMHFMKSPGVSVFCQLYYSSL